MTSRCTLAVFIFALTGAAAGCGGDSEETNPVPNDHFVAVFNGENEHLNAYDPIAGTKQEVVTGNEDESNVNAPALNGQICVLPGSPMHLIMGDDAGQPNPPAHWSLLELTGSKVGDFSVKRVATLTPSYQPTTDGAENYGCALLSDGRLLTTDVGNQAGGAGNGQLIIWFPPFDGTMQHYCKLDITLATAGGIYVDEQDRIYVAAARGAVYRYPGPFPTGDDAAHGCDATDMTADPPGAPMATNVMRETFIPLNANLQAPTAIARNNGGNYYITSVLNGVIAEYDGSGKFVRKIVAPPAGETIGTNPFSTGNPFGLGIDSSGTLYYADIALITTAGGIDIDPNKGTVRRVRFQDGAPLPPETLDSGLNFPDGIGILER